MGLDVRVYTNIKLSDDVENYSFKAYVMHDDWKYKVKNLDYGKYYKGDNVYRGVSCPCSCHNTFREKLINLIGRSDLLNEEGKIKWDILPKDIPFHDFIYFSDNEGCLDWEVSSGLYYDFEKYFYLAKSEMDEYYFDIYETWTETFLHGKNNGVVVFC